MSTSSSTPNLNKPAVQIPKPWLAMASLLIGAFVGMLSETSLNIALPKLMGAFNTGPATIQWLVTGYMLVIGIILPFSSLITKWFTTRKIVLFGLADFMVGAIISAVAPTFTVLLIGRMIQGIATGLILPLMFTVALQIFPPAKIGGALGVCALVIMLAPAIGPTITGLVLGKLSWNWIFWLFIPFLAIGFILALIGLKNISSISRPKVDLLSLVESMVAFSCLVTGVSLASDQGWGAWSVWLTLIVGTVVLFFYVHRQLNLTTPILNLKVFSKSAFIKGAICVMVDFGVILSAMYLLPQYIQKGMLLPVALTGIIMLPGGIVNAIVSAWAGRLYDKVGAKIPATIGFGLAAIGVILLALGHHNSSIAYIICAHVILMVGCPLAMSPSQSLALNSLSQFQSADGSTILNTSQQIIGALATALATSFLSWGQKVFQGKPPLAFTNGVHYGMYFTLILTLIGLLCALTFKNNKST